MVRRIIRRLTGKEINENISTIYLLEKGIPYLWGIFRGFFITRLFKNKGKRVFIGKNVKILMPSYLSVGDNVRIESNCKIDALSQDGIIIGNNSKIGEYSKIIGSGSVSHLGKGLRIGDNSYFSEYTFWGAAGGITIGDNIIAGQYVRFHSENHNYSDINKLIREQGVSHQGIKVGNNCWIGAGATFLDGSEIGDGVIVAANSVVTKKFGDNVIIAGIPAKVIKMRSGVNE